MVIQGKNKRRGHFKKAGGQQQEAVISGWNSSDLEEGLGKLRLVG